MKKIKPIVVFADVKAHKQKKKVKNENTYVTEATEIFKEKLYYKKFTGLPRVYDLITHRERQPPTDILSRIKYYYRRFKIKRQARKIELRMRNEN